MTSYSPETDISSTSPREEAEKSFNWSNFAIVRIVPDYLNFGHFTSIRYLCDGSNSNIYTALWNNSNVVIKIIQQEVMDIAIVKQEFELEIQILIRLNHPNIIDIYGWGFENDRIFLVLEPLDEVGSNLNMIKPFMNIRQHFNRGIRLCHELAIALSYIHNDVHRNAMVLHRDLKVENLGVSSSTGMLKMFDFGLAKVSRKKKHSNETFKMTGGTGTLRYMSPEVALHKPYNDKADVFSFGILCWCILTKQVPFKGFDRNRHHDLVVLGNTRPQLSPQWPEWLKELLQSAWLSDPTRRPDMEAIVSKFQENASAEREVSSKSTCCTVS